MANEVLGLKNINLLTKEQYSGIAEPATDELYAVEVSGDTQFKQMVASWGMPDYTAGIDKGNSFTSDGYYAMYVAQTFGSSGNKSCYVTINGVRMAYSTGGNWGAWVCPFFIKPGDVVALTTDASSISATCYPLGVN